MMQIAKEDLDLVRTSSLFDHDWYLNTYRDVTALRMDPAEHYLKYGALLRRDPGPDFSTGFYLDTRPGVEKKGQNPLVHYVRQLKRGAKEQGIRHGAVLWAAFNVSLRGRHDAAVSLAKSHVPEDLAYTCSLLDANAAIIRRDEAEWLRHLNDYLSHFGVAPLLLEGGGSLIDRFTTAPLPPAQGGPLISIIMPAWNAQDTIAMAVGSILKQTWSNLELLVVDDASEDGTWAELQRLAAADSRVKIMRNAVNVGPYASKNRALVAAQGEYVTGHDADDWAHPQRLENHMRAVLETQGAVRASLTYMVRMQTNGFFDTFSKQNEFSPDGVTRVASISCIFERKLLANHLGFWDCVRFGADSEMIQRTIKVVGDGFRRFHQIGMICLSTETGLTNHPEFGIRSQGGSMSPIRAHYKQSWTDWHAAAKPSTLRLDFPPRTRHFGADSAMVVPLQDLEKLIE